jgi:hypothetical protein
LDLGSNLSSSGTIPAGFKDSASAAMAQIIPYRARFLASLERSGHTPLCNFVSFVLDES